MHLVKLTRTARGLANLPFSFFRPFNVCMWHVGRCGSTVVGDLLNQDGRIVWGSEILEPYSREVETRNLQPKAWKGAKRRIRYKQLMAGARIFGIEMKVWHLKRIGVEANTVLNFLKRNKYDKHILLERKNYLRVIVSGYAGLSSSKWHSKIGENPVSAEIRLDLKVVNNHLRLFGQFFDEMKRILPENHLVITYEDDILHDPLLAYRKIANYLGLTPRAVAVKYQKTNPGDLHKIVDNFEEVRECLKGTKHEWMLTAN